MKLSTAMKTALPGQDPLAAAHIARYHVPGLFDEHDARFEGDRRTAQARVTRDLLNTWPDLGMRIRYIPGLTGAACTAFKLPVSAENWTLMKLIDRFGMDILPVLKKVRL